MKIHLLFLTFLFSYSIISAQSTGDAIAREYIRAGERQIPIYDYKGIKPIFQKQNDSIYIINFWATWCAPCVKELPHFETLLKKYKNEKLCIKLISLDFVDKVDKSLLPFLAKHKLSSDVLLLDDNDANFWINDIDSSWSGAIPATVIYNKKQRAFFEKSFTFEELENQYLRTKEE